MLGCSSLMKSSKSSVHKLFDMFTTHASLPFDIPETDCRTQNGSTYGYVLVTFKAWILNKDDDKQNEQLLCVCSIPSCGQGL